MRNKISKSGINRSRDDGIKALAETQRDIDLLIKDFDSNDKPGGRTLAAVCWRFLEEVKLVYKANEDLMPSMKTNVSEFINPMLEVSQAIFEDRIEYKFSTRKFALYMNKFPLLRPSGKVSLSVWKKEAVYFFDLKSNDKKSRISREDLISTMRNDVGAHFVKDITKRYLNASSAHKTFRQMGLNMHAPSLNLNFNNPVKFVNSPLPYMIRAIAAEIQAAIYDILSKENNNTDPEEFTKPEEALLVSVVSPDTEILDEMVRQLKDHHMKVGVNLRQVN